jgi:hypothetical protein
MFFKPVAGLMDILLNMGVPELGNGNFSTIDVKP